MLAVPVAPVVQASARHRDLAHPGNSVGRSLHRPSGHASIGGRGKPLLGEDPSLTPPVILRDTEIRAALHARLAGEYADTDTLVVNEMSLCRGTARADVAVVNGALHGFEIKSEADRLDRLENQQGAYGAIFDAVTLVTCPNHLAKGRAAVPAWWGIETAHVVDGAVQLRRVRKPKSNRNVHAEAVAALLWRDEALAILERHQLIHGLRSKPRRALENALADRLPLSTLAAEVRATLRARDGWLVQTS